MGSWEVETVKKLACRLGRHDWTTRVDEGESYKVCAYCGKTQREPGQQGRGVIDEGTDAKEGRFPDDKWGGISGGP